MGMVWLSKRRCFLAGVLIAAAIGAAFCLAFHFNLLHGMQLYSSDFLFSAANLHAGGEAEENNIVIVAIDDKSLEELGHLSSWQRSYHANLIDKLSKAGARIVVFDVLFSEPASGDEKLAASIKNSENVILPLVYTSTLHEYSATGESITFGNVIKPLETFEENAIAVGHANVVPDQDGVVRRLPLAVSGSEHYEPALALAAAAKYLRRPQIIESSINNDFLPFAGRLIPLDSANNMLINYTGDSANVLNFETRSYVDILRNTLDSADFRDKIVIIGATATGLGDTFWTPMGHMMNGVEIQASTIHTILTGNFLKPASSSVTIVSILVLALICGLAVLRLRILWATLCCIFICIAYFITAFFFFDNGIVLNMLYPPLATAGTFVGVNLYNVTYERTEKRKITKIFGRYLSPSVVDRILAALGEGKLNLVGREYEVTVAFADVRGFTSISEKLPTEELVRALNVYLSAIIKAIIKYDGMVNKFGGDSVMAIWNVPMECKGHALSAIKAAISAQHAIRELQAKETALPKMEFGIGINTGKAVAGNMGSEDRLEYSVIGDTVNTAAKLSNAAPGGKVWIGADTFLLVKDYVMAKPLDPLSIKGKREPVKTYEVLDIQDWQNDNQKK